MTREEIVSLIDEKKSKGFLNKDDYYEIGLAHRELPKSERSWSWLLALTGGFSSSEAYRCFVVHRLKSEVGSLETAHNKELTSQKQELFNFYF